MSDDPEYIEPTAPDSGDPPPNEVAQSDEPETATETVALAPTHLLWREGSVEFVALDGIDPDNPNLVEAPDGFTLEWMIPDFTARTFALDVSGLDACLLAQIDAEAEEARLRYITPGAGQAMEYDEAAAQAEALLAGAASDVSMLEADVEAGTVDPRTGEPVGTVEAAADLVLFMRAQWRLKGSAIRAARLSAKVAVRAATDRESKYLAAQVAWPE